MINKNDKMIKNCFTEFGGLDDDVAKMLAL